MNLVIAIDNSESILEGDPRGQPFHNWNLFKNLTYDIITDLGNSRVGLLTFSSVHSLQFSFIDHSRDANAVEATHELIQHLQFNGGSTNTGW